MYLVFYRRHDPRVRDVLAADGHGRAAAAPHQMTGSSYNLLLAPRSEVSDTYLLRGFLGNVVSTLFTTSEVIMLAASWETASCSWSGKGSHGAEHVFVDTPVDKLSVDDGARYAVTREAMAAPRYFMATSTADLAQTRAMMGTRPSLPFFSRSNGPGGCNRMQLSSRVLLPLLIPSLPVRGTARRCGRAERCRCCIFWWHRRERSRSCRGQQ